MTLRDYLIEVIVTIKSDPLLVGAFLVVLSIVATLTVAALGKRTS